MMDFYFFLKTMALTLAVVILMQIKIGNKSLEDQALMFFRSSMVEEPLTKMAHGGVKMARDAVKAIQDKINGTSSSEQEEKANQKRSSGFRFNWNS